MLKQFLLALTLLALPTAGAAQHAAPELPAPIRQSGVTVTLSGYLAPSTGGVLAVPPALLQRLVAEGELLALDTAPRDGRVVVQVRLGFADMDAFQRWYADQRTVQLLRDLRAATMGGSFETYLSYRPNAPQ